MAGQYILFYAPQCPNCVRFMEALDRTPMAQGVTRVDVNWLSPDQRSRIQAVPTMQVPEGYLTGTDAFKWLRAFEADVEPGCYGASNGLAYSSLDDAAPDDDLYSATFSKF